MKNRADQAVKDVDTLLDAGPLVAWDHNAEPCQQPRIARQFQCSLPIAMAGIRECVDHAVQIPPLKIQGIKTKAIPLIQDSVDWEGSGRWIEPFVGSAVVPFNIKPERALLGDANPHLIHFYAAIQRGTVTVTTVRTFLEREGAHLRRDGQEHYYRVRERFNERHDPHDFLFLNRACFNGLVRFNKKGNFNTPFCRKSERFRPAYITKICNQIQHAADSMADKSWEFVCADWADILSQARKDDFVYCYPPYIGRFTDYFNSWTDADALRLENVLKIRRWDHCVLCRHCGRSRHQH